MSEPCTMCGKRLNADDHKVVVHTGKDMPGLVAGVFCGLDCLIEGMTMIGRAASVTGALLVTHDTDLCTHDWIDIRNQVVDNGSWCRICGKLQAESVGAKAPNR